MKRTIVAALLLLLAVPALAAPQRRRPKETLSLTAAAGTTRYVEGGEIPVSLTFRNTGKKLTTFVLPGIERDPPGYITARVRDAEGNLLTLNDTLEDGWWTVGVYRSSYALNGKWAAADYVSLRPGEEYRRTIDLARLLRGCRCRIPDGLKAGSYKVQLSYGKVVSNEIEINVAK